MKNRFLPVSKEDMKERKIEQLDFVYVTGDAYVDHPSFGHAIIGRLLESRGYTVGMIPQPDWKTKESVMALGRPRLGFLVSGGNMDSKNDAIPSGIQGPCPDGWHVPSEAEWEILYKYVRDRIPENESAIYWDGSTVYNVSGHLRANVWPIKEDPDFPQLTKGGMDTYGFAMQTLCRRGSQ
ncbi:MAG: hypothetical protein BHW17_07980 [Dorea sp. 42_8]|nr:MAG: hypothetical protein BHW17_07980 [Dorea sp. 42_8]